MQDLYHQQYGCELLFSLRRVQRSVLGFVNGSRTSCIESLGVLLDESTSGYLGLG